VHAQDARAPLAANAPLEAFVYVQDESRLAGAGPHVGPLAEYTHEHAERLSW
jgi:hypothetical protein